MNDYYDKLVDNQLSRLSKITPTTASTQRAVDAARQAILDNNEGTKTFGIFSNPIMKLAIAAAIIVAVCLGIALMNSGNGGTPNKRIANPGNPNNTNTVAGTNNNTEKQEQLNELENLYATGNIEGLIAKLSNDDINIATAAADYLGKTGDKRAVVELKILAEKWQGETENPFEKALEEIRSRVEPDEDITKEIQRTEESEIIPSEPNSLDGANTKKEYKKPQNLYLIREITEADGITESGEMWIKLPNFYKEVSPDQTVIDNGKERLTLNHKEKTAQFADSLHLSIPLSEHHFVEATEMFRRKKMPDNTKAVKNINESNSDKIVYDLTITHLTNNVPREDVAKAWAYADSLLLAKVVLPDPDKDPNITDFQGETMTVNYSEIPDSVFDMKAPAAYKILERKKPVTFSGLVMDQAGNPVAGAKVHIKVSLTMATKQKMETYSDSDGFFTFSFPNQEGAWDHNPISFRAYLEDDPDHMAWTLLRSEKAKKDEVDRFALAGPIPEHVGKIEICERYDKGGPWCKGVSGIILQMEEAGTVFGRVKDSLGNPVTNAQVSVNFNIPNKHDHIRIYGHDLWSTTGKTDDQGYYFVNRLPKLWDKVKWGINASADGYNSKGTQEISNGPLDELQIDFELLLTGITVRGTVIDNYGRVLDERYVYVSAGKGNRSTGIKTDANGKFEINNCAITDKLKVMAELSRNSYPPHLTDKYKNYVYYPNVSKEIGMTDNTFEYEVDLVAELPALIFEIEVVDSSGAPLPYYPVGLRSAKVSIPSEWQFYKLRKRTDVNGYCKIKNVPEVEGLEVVLYGNQSDFLDNHLSEDIKLTIANLREVYSGFRFTEIPVGLVEGQKEYEVRAVVLTQDEYRESRKK